MKSYTTRKINRLLLALALITLGILVYKQEDHIGLHDDHPIQGLHYPVGVQTRSRPTHLGYKHGDNLDLIKSTTQKQREDIGQDLSASTTQSNPHYIKFGPPIVTLGDSLTEYGISVEEKGWVTLMAEAFRRKYDVLDRGYAGYTTDQYETMVTEVLTDIIGSGPSLTFITLMLGTNDANFKSPTMVPLDRYKRNLRSMVDQIRRICPNTPLILLTPPPVSEDWNPDVKFAYRNAVLELFAKATREGQTRKAQKYSEIGDSLIVVDTWTLFFPGTSAGTFIFERDYNPAKVKAYLTDGVHFNQKGNRVIFTGVTSAIQKNFPSIL